MRHFIRGSIGLGLLAPLIVASGIFAQGAATHVVQSGDGTLYVAQGNTAWLLAPADIGDDDLGALTLGGEVDAFIDSFTPPLQVVQGGDGTLYAVQGGTAWLLFPGQIGDYEVSGLTIIGTATGGVPDEPA